MDCSEEFELTKADLQARKFTVANRDERYEKLVVVNQHTTWQTEATNPENFEL